MPRCSLPAVLLLLLTVGPLPAGEPPARMPLPGESAGTGRRLDAADRLAADKQYASAADEYARIIDEAGDDLVAVGPHLVIPARRLCQLRLAALPPEALRSYRTRVDPQAKKWLDQGTADRDVRLLQRIVDETFCSRPTEAALDLLGDLAFEQGRFHEAGRWWRMLALPASETAARAKQPLPWEKDKGQKDENGFATSDLLYPDPQTDVARARAKQVLAMLFRGEVEAARTELAAFRALHPKAEGHLAGRKGNYADILQALANRPIPEAPAEDAWPTFGGAPSRGAVLSAERSDPNRLNTLVTDGPAWRFSLGDLRRPAGAKARHLAFHPVISGRHVFVADARTVTAIDTATGDKLTWDLGREGGRRLNMVNGLALDTTLPTPADLRYTLTAADGRIYARLGVQGLSPAKQGAEADSFLVCLKLADGGRKLTAAWLREAEPAGKGARPVFEGAPVVADGLLHVAATRFEGGTQTVTEVRCYSTDSDSGPRWRQDVFTTRDQPTTPRYRHQLLTRAGRYVVYASHAGAVVALDARTGRRAWAFRYPGAPVLTPAGNPVPRDLAPPLYANGRLYVAPADYDRLLCLDPETGQLLWERERVDVVHLLGVGHGRLIFTTPKGIRAVRADDGDDTGGWLMPEPVGTQGLPSFGRGFLAGEYVFWPTTSGVKVLSQDDGRVPIDLIPGPLEVRGRLSPGNLAYAGGILAVADLSELRIYLPPGRGRRDPLDKPAAVPAQSPTAPAEPREEVVTWHQPAVKPSGPGQPLTRSWEKCGRLLSSPGGPRGTDMLLYDGTSLDCRDIAAGVRRWARPLRAEATWAGRDGPVVAVGGPGALLGFAASGGTPLWERHAPNPKSFTHPRLSAFRLAGGLLFCLQGECRLLALDLASGRVLWQRWAPAARLGANVPGTRFSPHFLATGERVLIQTEGHCLLLDARNGSVVRDLPTEAILWRQPPLPFGDGRAAVVNGQRRVISLDLHGGKVAWEYALTGATTLSGELPLLLGNSDALFVVVPRNAGYTLQRLDPTTGRPVWAAEVALELDRLDPSCFALDAAGVYYTSRNVLTALDLDGKRLWEQTLPGPEGPWRLRRTAAALVAWPAQAQRTKFHSRWLTASLELEATLPPEDRPGRGIPVLLLAPAAAGEKEPGDRVIQRLNLVPPGPRAQGRLADGEELTAVPRAFAERAAAAGPVVIETAAGLVVGWGGKTWALRRDK